MKHNYSGVNCVYPEFVWTEIKDKRKFLYVTVVVENNEIWLKANSSTRAKQDKRVYTIELENSKPSKSLFKNEIKRILYY